MGNEIYDKLIREDIARTGGRDTYFENVGTLQQNLSKIADVLEKDSAERQDNYERGAKFSTYRENAGRLLDEYAAKSSRYADHFKQYADAYDAAMGEGTTERILAMLDNNAQWIAAVRQNLDAEGQFWGQFASQDDYDAYRRYRDTYAGIPEREDYAEKSAYVSTELPETKNLAERIKRAYTGDFSDLDYEIVNGNEKARGVTLTNQSPLYSLSAGDVNAYLDHIDETQKGVFNYLYATEGKESAMRYLKEIEGGLKYQQAMQEEERWREMAGERPVLSSVATVLTAPVRGFGYVAEAADMMTKGQIDPYNPATSWSRVSNTVRGEVTRKIEESGKWGKAGSFAYGIGTSMGDFLMNLAASAGSQPIALALMGTGAAADATLEAKQRGLDDVRAFALGTIAGGVEIITEKFSVEALLGADFSQGIAKYVLKNMLTEASEEMAADYLNECYDLLIAGDKAKFRLDMQQRIEAGQDPTEAFFKTLGAHAAQMGLDGLAGAVSGGVMAGAGAGVNFAMNAGSLAEETSAISGYLSRMEEHYDALQGQEKAAYGQRAAAYLANMKEMLQQTQKANAEDLRAGEYEAARKVTRRIDLLKSKFEGNTGTATTAKTADSQAGTPLSRFALAAGIGTAGMETMQAYSPQNNADTTQFAKDFVTFYNAGRQGRGIHTVAGSAVKLSQNGQAAAYNAGQMDAIREGGQRENQVYVRDGGQRTAGADTGRIVSVVESGAGQTAAERTGSAGQSTLASRENGTFAQVSAKDLGITGGDDTARVTVVRHLTAEQKKIKTAAEGRGLSVVFFAGGDLSVGGNKNVRALIDGDKVYVRTDHGRFTAQQLTEHEMTHDRIRKGEIRVADVRRTIADKLGEEGLATLDACYRNAYAGTGYAEDVVREEMVCDLEAGMNVFGSMRPEAKKLVDRYTAGNTTAERAEEAAPRGPPAEVNEKSAAPKASTEENDQQSGKNEPYDFSKSFAEQIDDLQRIPKTFPRKDTLVVCETPKVFQQIGLQALPMTYTQSHAWDNIHNYDGDHLGEALLKEVPGALQDPIAIIDSSSQPGRLVAIIELKGQPRNIIAAIEINGEGIMHGDRIDSNAILTIHSRDNALSKLLSDAVVSEVAGRGGIYYWQKNKATAMARSRGVQFPGCSTIADGFIRSIYDFKSNVKPKLKNIFETKQFKRWFGQSKVVNEDGTPIAVYHGTDAQFYAFEEGHPRKAYSAGKNLGEGFYFTQKQNHAEMYGQRVMAVYVSLQNPYIHLGTQFDFQDLKALSDKAGYTIDKHNVSDYLKAQGYDGIIAKSFDGAIDTVVAFKSTQIKSATDNIGTFDGSNPDIRFSQETDEGADAGRIVKITADMSDEERYNALKDRYIEHVPEVHEVSERLVKAVPEIKTWSDINRYFGKEKRTLIQKIASEFGAIGKEYQNKDIELSFEFSRNNFDESYSKQKRNFEYFAKMFSVFDDIVSGAVGIEVHRRSGYKEDAALRNVFVLVGAYQDGENIVPVKLEIKEFADKQNTLYVAVALEAIKKDEVSGSKVVETDVARNPRSSNISIAQLFKNINSSDESFYKYIPRQFFDNGVRTSIDTDEDAKPADQNFYERMVSAATQVSSKEERAAQLIHSIAIKADELRAFADRKYARAHDFPISINVLDDETFKGLVKTASSIFMDGQLSPRKVRENISSLVAFFNRDNQIFMDFLHDLATAQDGSADAMLGVITGAFDALSDQYDEESGTWSGDPLSVAELAAVEKILRLTRKMYTSFDAIYEDGKRRNLTEAARGYCGIAQQVRAERPAGSAFLGKVKDTVWLYNAFCGAPNVVAGHLDGYKPGGFFTHYVERLQQDSWEAQRITMELMKPAEDFIKTHKGYDQRLTKERIPFKGTHGTEILVGEAINIYLTATQQNGALTLYGKNGGGFSYTGADGKVASSTLHYTVADKRKKGRSGADELKDLYNAMSKEDREFIEIVKEIYRAGGVYKKKTDIERIGFSDVRDSGYYWITRDKTRIKTSVGDARSELRDLPVVNNIAFNKKRSKNAHIIPLAAENAWSKMAEYCRLTGMYAAFSADISNFNRIYNKNVDDENKGLFVSVRLAAGDVWQGTEKYFRTYLSGVQGVRRKEAGAFDRAMAAARSNYAKAVLGLNPKVIVSQFASYPAAGAYLDPDVMLKALNVVTVRSDHTDMDRYSVTAMLRNADKIVVKAESLYDRIGTVADAGTKGIQLNDRFTIGRLWVACQLQVAKDEMNRARDAVRQAEEKGEQSAIEAAKKHLESVTDGIGKVGTEDNKKAAGALLDKINTRTQPTYQAADRSALQRSENEVVKAMAMFTSVSMKQFSLVIGAVDKVLCYKQAVRYAENVASRADEKSKKGADEQLKQARENLKRAKREMGRTLSSVLAANLLYSLLCLGVAALFGRLRGKKTPKEFAELFISTNVSMFPFIKQIYDVFASGFDIETAPLSSVNDLFNAIKGIFSDKYTVAKRIDTLLEAVSALFLGLPVQNLRRYTIDAISAVADAADNYVLQYHLAKLKYRLDPQNGRIFYDILYEAYQNSPDDFAEIYQDMIDRGWKPENIAGAMESRMKEESGVKSVGDLKERFLAPDEKKAYDKAVREMKKADVWKGADKTQQERALDIVNDYAAGRNTTATRRIDDGKDLGLSADEYALYIIALDMVDEPNASGKRGTYTKDEMARAVELLGDVLDNDEEKEYLRNGARKNK